MTALIIVEPTSKLAHFLDPSYIFTAQTFSSGVLANGSKSRMRPGVGRAFVKMENHIDPSGLTSVSFTLSGYAAASRRNPDHLGIFNIQFIGIGRMHFLRTLRLWRTKYACSD